MKLMKLPWPAGVSWTRAIYQPQHEMPWRPDAYAHRSSKQNNPMMSFAVQCALPHPRMSKACNTKQHNLGSRIQWLQIWQWQKHSMFQSNPTSCCNPGSRHTFRVVRWTGIPVLDERYGDPPVHKQTPPRKTDTLPHTLC